MIKLVLATNNAHKISEIKSLLPDSDFEILTLDDLGFEGDIEEYGSTLEENALIKARFIFEKYGIPCLADDSGLEVPALNNEPGVYSARYAGPERSHDKNMDLLLHNLENQNNRSASFKTVMALIWNNKEYLFTGTVMGKIGNKKIGNGGFGYDPIFYPEGQEITFAQMTSSQKNSLSHRARALAQVIDFLKK